MRWAWAEVSLDAIAHNVATLRDRVAPAAVWAVVKADAYGHGALPVATAALGAGAAGLCVAFVQEGVQLRRAGVAAPILVLSEQPADELAELVGHGLIATVYSVAAIDALARAVAAANAEPVRVHVKFDTGMHRVGAHPAAARELLDAISVRPELTLDGVFTHLAVADTPNDPYNDIQLDRFGEVLEHVATSPPRIHAANSAAALALAASRFDLVRVGIAMYGIVPGPQIAAMCTGLRPALRLVARVSWVARHAAGERLSYGLRHTFERDSTIATVPIGYADGVSRRLFETGGEVLIHGRRRPIVGVVTMDSLMVDCGTSPVQIGDEVVLIGAQAGGEGSDEVMVTEWAARLGTIGYEIVCAIGARIERHHSP